MLYRFTSTETIGDDGRPVINIGPDVEPTPCTRCGSESFGNVCPGDGRYHHHGCVHTVDGGLEPLCHDCIKVVDEEWETARAK